VEALVASLALARFQAQPAARASARSAGAEVVEGHPRCGKEWRAVDRRLACCCSSVLGHLTLAGTLARVAALVPLVPRPGWPAFALLGRGRPILVARRPGRRPRAPSMDTLVGPGGWVVPTGSLVAFLWPAVVGPVSSTSRMMLLGFVLWPLP